MSTPFRFINPVQQYLYESAIAVLAGGNLHFYESGTSTPQATYTDPTLVTQNPNPVPLNSVGVPIADIWMNGNYRVVLQDSSGNTLWTADNVEIPGGSAQAIPTLVNGDFLTTDGTNLIWQPITQLPDQSGQNGKYLATNGTDPIWQSLPAAATAPTITVTSASLKLGFSAPFYYQQWGSSTVPATGSGTANGSVTFPVPFATAPSVDISPTNAQTANGILSWQIGAPSTTGFTIQFNNNLDGASIVNPPAFNWKATGTVSS